MSCTETIYIESAASLAERAARLTTIINALELRMVDVGASDSNIDEYSIDDGQVKISTKYRSPESIAKAIHLYEGLLQKTLNKLNGRCVVLRSARGMY